MYKYSLSLICSIFAVLSLMMLRSVYPSGVPLQLFAFLVGAGVYIFAFSVPFSIWKGLSVPLFVLVCVALIITLVLGKTTKGSIRWVSVGSAQFQPSQVTKLLLALYLCVLLTQKKKSKKLARVALATLPILLVFAQPDLGTALVLVSAFALSLYFSQVPLKILFGLTALGMFIGAISWSLILRDYQKQRILSFLSPTEDVLGRDYHANQSVIAIGSGKIFGRGLGHGTESSLRFLPERQTDFMFASYAEELGLVGVVLLLFLYMLLFAVLLWMSAKIIDPVGKAFTLTMIGTLFVQTGMNIGMNLGLLPITGITLPLISLGGSSIISILFTFGLIASAYRANPRRHLVEIRSFV